MKRAFRVGITGPVGGGKLGWQSQSPAEKYRSLLARRSMLRTRFTTGKDHPGQQACGI